MSKDTVFQAKHSHCLSSSSYLGASSLYVFSSTIIQMVSRGSHHVSLLDGRPLLSSFKSFWHHVCMCVAFFSSRLSNISWSYIFIPLCSKLWHSEVEVFFTFLSCRFIAHILSALPITFLNLKKEGHTLLGLSSKVFTFDHLFTYIIQTLVNSLTISLTEWPENQRNRCLIFSANSVGLYFSDRVEKIKENGKKTKTENLQNGQEKYGGKKLAYVHIWAKTSKIL